MKKIALLMTTLLIAALIVPKFIGDRSKEAYLQSIDNYPKDDATISFEHKSYEQSWFSSQAVTVMKIAAGAPGEAIEWILTSEIQHGPLLFTDKGPELGIAYVKTASSFSGLPEELQQLVDTYLAENPIVMTALIDLDLLSHDAMTIPAISFENEKASGTIGGLQLAGTSQLDYSSIKGDIKLPASQILGDDVAMNIADGSGSYDYRKLNDFMLVGKSDITMPSIEVVASQQIINLKGLSAAVNITEQNSKINMTEKVSIAKVEAPLPVTAFHYNFDLNQLDPKALELWSKLQGDLQSNLQSNLAATGMNTNPEVEEKLRQLLLVLLQNGLELNQLLKLDAYNGTLSIDWDTKYVGLADNTHVLDVEDKAQLLKAVNAHLLIEADTAVVSSSPLAMVVTPYIENGYVVEKAGKLVSDIKLADGVMTINEQPFPIENILGLLGPTPAAQDGAQPAPQANGQL